MERLQQRVFASITLAAFVTSSCGGKATTTKPIGGGSSPLGDQALVQSKDLPPGLDLRLSDGRQGAPAYDHATLAPATTLSAAESDALLARGKPLASDPDDQKAFALRAGSQPPPRTGQTIKSSFPPPPSSLLPPAASDAGQELRVLRYMPEGKVPLAPELSVTFSQPMVAVTSQGDAAATVPVKLTPTPPGKWRWLGTRTALFDPAIRFPQSTTYQVEVPAGTKSANGGVLKAPVKFSFETPPLQVTSSYPSGGQPQRLDVPMWIRFDQRIDPAAVLPHVAVTANGKPVAIRRLEATEVAADRQLTALVTAAAASSEADRWIAFKATSPLPTDAAIAIMVGAGTPSAEGPNLSTGSLPIEFRTYAPLGVTTYDCGYNGECPPGSPFQIQFNNALDVDKFDAVQVTISPALPGVKVENYGRTIAIMGPTTAHTTYKVVLNGGIVDEFGQHLGKDSPLEFHVTNAVPTFYGPEGMVVLDPVGKARTLDFFSTNYPAMKVRIYKVGSGDFDAYANYLRNQWNKDKPPRLPGKQVVDKLISTTAGKDKLVETALDLSAALSGDGFGQAIAIVEPSPWTEDYDPPRMVSWVQSTHLGVDAHVDGDQLVAMVTDLATGKPAAGVALEMRPSGQKAKTDDKGMATLALPAHAGKGTAMLVATRGTDVAFVTDDSGWYSEAGGWTKQSRAQELAWYVVDDRKLYKPGEEMSLKGLLRVVDPGKGGDVGGTQGAVTTVGYEVTDSQGNQIAKGSTKVSAVGSFDFKVKLPKTPNLGYGSIAFQAHGSRSGSYSHMFQIEEFRRPEFEVTAAASQGPFMVGGGGDVTVNAKYYAGGPLGGAAVRWNVSATPTSYTPPNRDDFTFGEWIPWWSFRGPDDERGGYGGGGRGTSTWTLEGKTDGTGAHVLHFDFLSVKPARPMAVTASASVMDVNRQAWSASAPLIVHPSSLYVGVKAAHVFVEKGTPYELDVIGVDLDGKAAVGTPIEVKAVRLESKYAHGKYTTEELDPQTCSLASAQAPGHCSFQTPTGGSYQVTALIVDSKGRPNTTKLTFWVAGGDVTPSRELTQEVVQLIPNQKEYRQGETADILVQSPFYPAEVLVTWRRSGIVKVERTTLTGPTTTVHVPITDAMVPNLYVQVDVVGAAARLDDAGVVDPKLPKRPAYAVGSLSLAVPPKQRALAVTIAPAVPKLGPGETTTLSIDVKDAAGRPVAGAETAVIVVDEAVLSLAAYTIPDPLGTFYTERDAGARDHYSRAYVKLARPALEALAAGSGLGGAPGVPMPSPTAAATMNDSSQAEMAPSRGMASPKKLAPTGEAERQKGVSGGVVSTDAIAIRSDFNPLAAFAPTVTTDAQGHATVQVKVPDNLTRYRIVAIASAGAKQFGKGESALTARLPLMVRPSPPRFLNFGDTFQLPVVVQNQTDAPMTVKVAVRATNAVITNGAGRQVTVPANDRVEIRFPAAAQLAGTARFQIIGSAGGASDAAELALPVWTPATTEAFATYGVIDDGAMKQPVALPGQVVTQFGGLEVTTASTNLQGLTDAMLYLVHYPFECSEQRSSRIMAVAALRDVLTAFAVKDMPSKAAMEASVAADIEHLSQMQNSDGGFAYWERGYPSVPYLSVYVVNALLHAKAKGFTVPDAILARAKPYLLNIEQHYDAFYPVEVRRAISAYALYTRKQSGDVDVAKAHKLIADAGGTDKLGMETVGWLMGTLAGTATAADDRKALVRTAMNHVSETAGAANFTTSYADGAYLLLASDRRVDAVMLESLIQEQKDNDLIPKLVTGLLAHRKAGRWLNTQENTYALLAFDRYFETYEKATPSFVARVWLGSDYAGDHAFKGRTTDYAEISIPMAQVATHDRQPLTIQKDGTGRLYYRIGMTYAPASLELAPADYGFVVERTYEGADQASDVVRQADGSWKVKAGARVRVKLKMANENRRYHVALVDPMPAGFEAMNPALATTGPIPLDPKVTAERGDYWWWYGPWYEHQNLRDERVEAFAAMLWEGVHSYEYVARATTPGTFVVPPTKAEEMYMPETFGRSGSDRVIVE